MGRKEEFIEKLARIGQEYERKLTNEEWVKERLRWEDWESLSKEAVAVAAGVLKRRRRNHVLPGGYDAKSIAAQVIADLLEGKDRIVAGWTRERLTKELERLIRGKIRLLEMLKETSVTRTEWKTNGDGTAVSVLRQVRDESANGYETLVARERVEERKRLKRKVIGFLASEPELAGIFECWCQGITNPAEIGQKLGMDEKGVVRARKRLDRRLARFRKERVESKRNEISNDGCTQSGGAATKGEGKERHI